MRDAVFCLVLAILLTGAIVLGFYIGDSHFSFHITISCCDG
jgi:hypothetical protein